MKFSLVTIFSELVFGADVLDLDFWVQIDSIEQPIQRNSVGSGHVSHCRASSLLEQAVVQKRFLKYPQYSVCHAAIQNRGKAWFWDLEL